MRTKVLTTNLTQDEDFSPHYKLFFNKIVVMVIHDLLTL